MDYSLFSNQGNRITNEDFCSVKEVSGKICFTLCDGLGGHANGEVASRTVAETFCNVFETSGSATSTFFENAFSESQRIFNEKAKETPVLSLMKTTVVSLVIDSQQCIWAHIGDSRLYAFKNNRVTLCTSDHSIPEMLVRTGKLSRAQIRNHPDRNKLLRAFGCGEEKTEYEAGKQTDISSFDAFLLCSDGFWELINERKMLRCLNHSTNSTEWINRMARFVKKKGKRRDMDNYSAIAVIIKKEGEIK